MVALPGKEPLHVVRLLQDPSALGAKCHSSTHMLILAILTDPESTGAILRHLELSVTWAVAFPNAECWDPLDEETRTFTGAFPLRLRPQAGHLVELLAPA